jgi:hypothetical protein
VWLGSGDHAFSCWGCEVRAFWRRRRRVRAGRLYRRAPDCVVVYLAYVGKFRALTQCWCVWPGRAFVADDHAMSLPARHPALALLGRIHLFKSSPVTRRPLPQAHLGRL